MKKHPVLYQGNETQFSTNGLGVLSDAAQCDVTEELNGVFELFMEYPSNGRLMNSLKNNRIIYADASREMGMQPFRIYSINKLMNGFVNVYARHISYDMGGIQLPPMSVSGVQDGLTKIKQYSTTSNPFVFTTEIIEDDPVDLITETPKSVRSFLMGSKDSILAVYGGEFVFDKYNVRHGSQRGSDKGYRVRYGVNLIDLNQEESIENTYTGIFPYYKSQYMYKDLTESFDLMYPMEIDRSKLGGKIRYADGTFEHQKIANVDLSSRFESDQLYDEEFTDAVDQYMAENKIGIPSVSLDLKFVELNSLPEYSNIPTPEAVALGDTIHVDYVKLGVSATARVNTIIYDSLTHKNKRVILGDAKNNVTDSIVKSINTQPTSQSISGDKLNLTGYVTFTSLGANGTTSIDGSRIKTGQISSENYKNDFIVINPSVETVIASGEYWFSLVYEKIDRFVTFTMDIPIGGKIYYFPSEKAISTYNAEGALLETVPALDSGDNKSPMLKTMIDAYFSEKGTMIDLVNGDIISDMFSLIKGNSFFRGKIKTDDAQFGNFVFDKNGFLLGITDVKIGDYSGEHLYNGTHVLSSEKGYFGAALTNDDLIGGKKYAVGFRIGTEWADELPENLVSAGLYGKWFASPFTGEKYGLSGNVEKSEIVTKTDLVNLGLINE